MTPAGALTSEPWIRLAQAAQLSPITSPGTLSTMIFMYTALRKRTCCLGDIEAKGRHVPFDNKVVFIGHGEEVDVFVDGVEGVVVVFEGR